jgi:hypothetical protein
MPKNNYEYVQKEAKKGYRELKFFATNIPLSSQKEITPEICP